MALLPIPLDERISEAGGCVMDLPLYPAKRDRVVEIDASAGTVKPSADCNSYQARVRYLS